MTDSPRRSPRPIMASVILPTLVLACFAGVAASAQEPVVPSADARVRAALETIQRDNAWTLDQQVSICEIPAPPFKEERRAAEYRRRLEALGLRNVRIDAEGNVIAERPGTGGGPTVMLSGHLDTVFPEGTDVTVRREGTRFHAPGIGDDCRGLAVVLAVARAFQEANVRTNGTVYFVGTVGEEGPGNLRGVRHLFTKEFPNREIDYFISVDGTGYGTTSGAVGSNRYRVSYLGPGGHSYGAFGMPNPIHALGRAIAGIGDVQVPATPRTTFNVGVISGGTSVNSISAEGVMEIDMRSPSLEALGRLDTEVRGILQRALEEENARWPRSSTRLTMRIDTIGIRPAGSQPDSAPIVRAALASARALAITSSTNASSTDANLPISLGIPAITIDGGGQGRGAHSLDEWYDDGADGYRGPQWAALLVATLAGVR
ncbi:MAG TPA: M20/M25/M40 family metallo-hydrolase [Gemmatimonadaceae bacterium]|nr:M20/M25/M40 family metallo-hydrolase [Gemmatimonadaceae bacterium]